MSIKKMKRVGVIAAALAELQKERVKDATAKLKSLYDQERKAKKVLKNVQREIADYLEELEIDEEDSEDES